MIHMIMLGEKNLARLLLRGSSEGLSPHWDSFSTGEVDAAKVRRQELNKGVWLLRIISDKAPPTTHNSSLCGHIFFQFSAGTNRTSLSNYLHNGSSAQDYSLRLRVTPGRLFTKFLERSRFLHRRDRVSCLL